MIRFLINVPESLRDTLRNRAIERGQTLNGLIRQILWDWAQANQTNKKRKREE